jgi:alkaline phosphatase
VILGGGRKEFRSKNVIDEDGTSGSRTDDVDLIEIWKADKLERNASFRYLWNRDQLLSVDPAASDFVLGECLSIYTITCTSSILLQI